MPLDSFLQRLRMTTLLHEAAGVTDAQLLEPFITRKDAAAFAALVRRHGPMVWGVCRRALSQVHDAEDAFQATFLVLIRKASPVVPRAMIGNWLHGVAYRTAMKARLGSTQRRVKERQVEVMPDREVPKQDLWRDLQPLLDQELDRLPDKYRVAIVLCDLEGKTHKEAARELDWPVGTLSTRLVRGRALLAKRLTRHGVVLSGAALAPLLLQNVSAASVPASVLSTTISAVANRLAGHAVAAGVISANVAALTEGVLKTMLLNKAKRLVAVLLAVSVIDFTASVWAYQTLGAGDEPARIDALKNPMATGQKEVLDPAPTLRATVEGHGKMILCAAISSDGKLLASGDLGGKVKLLDIATGKEKTTLRLPGAVMCVTFSDGKLLACGGRSYESTLGGGRRSFLKLWDLTTGKEKANLEGHGVGPSILSVAFSGDGKLLASGATDGTAKLWDVATGKEKASLSHPGDVTLALSRDGKLLATGCKNNDSNVRLWDVATGKLKALLKGHESNVPSVAFSGDGKLLASVDGVGVVKLWDVATESEKATFNHRGALALTADGRFLASVDSEAKAVRLWDVGAAKEKAAVKGALFDMTSSSDVRLLVTADSRLLATVSPNGPGTLKLWEFPLAKRSD